MSSHTGLLRYEEQFTTHPINLFVLLFGVQDWLIAQTGGLRMECSDRGHGGG